MLHFHRPLKPPASLLLPTARESLTATLLLRAPCWLTADRTVDGPVNVEGVTAPQDPERNPADGPHESCRTASRLAAEQPANGACALYKAIQLHSGSGAPFCRVPIG